MVLDRAIGKDFDKVSEVYENVRPDYPIDLIEKIIEFSNLPKHGKILEIGAGSGKATLPFAKYDITAIEPSENLIKIAKDKTAEFSNVKYLKSTFEDISIPENHFDLLISGTAFHWVDPRVGYEKAGKVLKQNGSLALFWNKHNYEKIDFIDGILSFYNKYSDGHYTSNDSVDEAIRKIEETDIFEPLQQFIYQRNLTYSKENYVKLVGTFGWVISSPRKEEMLGELRELLKEVSSPLQIPYATVLLITRKK